MLWNSKEKERLQVVLKEAILKNFQNILTFPCKLDAILCISPSSDCNDQLVICIHNSLINNTPLSSSIVPFSGTTTNPSTLRKYLSSSNESTLPQLIRQPLNHIKNELVQLNEIQSCTSPTSSSLFSCSLCLSDFPSKDFLTVHFANVHSSQMSHFCTECKVGFDSWLDLSIHNKNFHNTNDGKVEKLQVKGTLIEIKPMDEGIVGGSRRKQLKPKKGVVEMVVRDKEWQENNENEYKDENNISSKGTFTFEKDNNNNYTSSYEDKQQFTLLEDISKKNPSVTTESPFKCNVCTFLCEDLKALEEHCFSLHRKYTCNFCPQLFPQKVTRDRHVYQHHQGEKPFPCSDCLSSFTRRDTLRKHQVKMKHGPYQNTSFETMDQSGWSENGLDLSQRKDENHLRGSDDEDNILVMNTSLTPSPYQSPSCSLKVFKCDRCEEVIDGMQEFKEHCKLIHRRTPCLHCGKTFSQKGNMERHRRQHTGERPFSCPHCPSTYTRRETLKSHLTQAHGIKMLPSLGNSNSLSGLYSNKIYNSTNSLLNSDVGNSLKTENSSDNNLNIKDNSALNLVQYKSSPREDACLKENENDDSNDKTLNNFKIHLNPKRIVLNRSVETKSSMATSSPNLIIEGSTAEDNEDRYLPKSAINFNGDANNIVDNSKEAGSDNNNEDSIINDIVNDDRDNEECANNINNNNNDNSCDNLNEDSCQTERMEEDEEEEEEDEEIKGGDDDDDDDEMVSGRLLISNEE